MWPIIRSTPDARPGTAPDKKTVALPILATALSEAAVTKVDIFYQAIEGWLNGVARGIATSGERQTIAQPSTSP
jgi:hypothetical protein